MIPASYLVAARVADARHPEHLENGGFWRVTLPTCIPQNENRWREQSWSPVFEEDAQREQLQTFVAKVPG